MRTTVTNSVGKWDVSTMCTFDQGWETCLFGLHELNEVFGSNVVAHYSDEDEAITGHDKIVELLEDGMVPRPYKDAISVTQWITKKLVYHAKQLRAAVNAEVLERWTDRAIEESTAAIEYINKWIIANK